MNRRAVCFVTAGILFLLLSVSALACDHYDEQGAAVLELRGKIEPQIGQEGYSGDFCCKFCGEIIVRGQKSAALEDPNLPPVTDSSSDAHTNTDSNTCTYADTHARAGSDLHTGNNSGNAGSARRGGSARRDSSAAGRDSLSA